MATVNVGSVNQYMFFGTGSDLLPATDKNTINHLLGILDTGAATGTKSVDRALAKSSGATVTVDERVTAFPAVAGDIVFFTTTTLNPSAPLHPAEREPVRVHVQGGAAYDTNNDSKFSSQDSVLVTTIAGERATAPFIVDQHLLFGSGKNVSMFGNKDDFNNGVGQAGVRILSWREVQVAWNTSSARSAAPGSERAVNGVCAAAAKCPRRTCRSRFRCGNRSSCRGTEADAGRRERGRGDDARRHHLVDGDADDGRNRPSGRGSGGDEAGRAGCGRTSRAGRSDCRSARRRHSRRRRRSIRCGPETPRSPAGTSPLPAPAYEQAVTQRPDDAEALNNLGLALERSARRRKR